MLLLEKVLSALLNYRSDKKQIYRALYALGLRYSSEIGKIYGKLGLNEVDEPNCKNLAYKAKMVLCHSWWKSKYYQSESVRLPAYFVKHMLYISDVEAYLFENASMVEEAGNAIDVGALAQNLHHFIRFIECEEDISQ